MIIFFLKKKKFSDTLEAWSIDLNTDFTLNDCLDGSVKLTTNTDPDKYKYRGCDIGYNSHSEFALTDSSVYIT